VGDVYREKLTSAAGTVVISRTTSPMDIVEVLEGQELFRVLSTMSDMFRPENYDKADGAPMTLFAGETVRVDLSKRSVEDMGFWHRSADFNEIILCLKGALHWETELGETTLRPGDMIWIPRGIAHRSMLCEESLEENVLIELKVREDLRYMGDDGATNG
jgi:mannose-6-phosphate isomerase-like protein (cupin superfamily)